MTETDGNAAIARLAAGERFDLVICDLMMPNVTGIDVFEAINAIAPLYGGAVRLFDRWCFLTPRHCVSGVGAEPCIHEAFQPPPLSCVR